MVPGDGSVGVDIGGQPTKNPAVLDSGVLLTVYIGVGWLVVSPNSPTNRFSAIRSTQEWARLADFPSTMTDFHIETGGSMFTREFQMSFRDSPTNIRIWLASSPGPASTSPTTDSSGWLIYNYPAGGGAEFSEVRVSPAGDEVRIRAYWS